MRKKRYTSPNIIEILEKLDDVILSSGLSLSDDLMGFDSINEKV